MTQCLTALETEYQAAKSRLQAAQQEKLEAAAEFLSARAALRQTLEILWPSSCEYGTIYAGGASELDQQRSSAELVTAE